MPKDAFRDEDGKSAPWLRPELVAPWWEIALVVGLVVGHYSVASAWQAWNGSSLHYVNDIATNARMVSTLAMEGAVLGLLFIYLNRRGWKWSDFRIRPTWISSAQAFPLIFAMALANAVTVISSFLVLYNTQTRYHNFILFLIANSPHLAAHSVQVSWFAVIPAMALNAFFEEITCIGYAFCQFAEKRGPLFALILTVLLRMSCHTYQGGAHALGIGAVFLVTGLFYWRTQNLWPLILSHAIADTVAMGLLKILRG